MHKQRCTDPKQNHDSDTEVRIDPWTKVIVASVVGS